MAISTAISTDRVSRVVGYRLRAAQFGTLTPYLPQRIAILGEANTANQAALTTDPFEFTSDREVGDKYGYGSPLHMVARILRPQSGNILGGITTVIYPQISAGGAVATTIKKSVTCAAATANTTHYVIIAGRDNIDGVRYAYNVVIGDNAAAIIAKIISAVGNVLSCPVTAALNVADIDFVSKWKGATSAELSVSFDTGTNAAGVVYAEVSKTSGTGVVTVSTSLALFGSTWNTLVVNSGVGTLADFELFNGVPDVTNPTGRYQGNNFKPCVVFTGSVLSDKASLIAITDADARKTQVTNVIAPAPASKGCTWEAAANMVASYAFTAANKPHLGNGGLTYPDMPVPSNGNIGDFSEYDNRDYLVQRGCSTVTLENGKYTVQDMVTTYHPTGETPPKFRFVRDLIVDWNIAFGWQIIMNRDIHDKTLVGDNDAVTVDSIVSPKQGKQLLRSFVRNMAALALIANSDFTIENMNVEVNGTNPARLDFYFPYLRTSVANIVSTDAAVDFAYSL